MTQGPDCSFTEDMKKMFVMVVQVVDEKDYRSRQKEIQPFHCESEELALAWRDEAIKMFSEGKEVDLIGSGYQQTSSTEFLDLLVLPLHVWLMPDCQETVSSLDDLL